MMKIALETGLLEIEIHDFRKFAEGKHMQADDAPYGGGPGMVLMLKPIVDALENLIDTRIKDGFERTRLILLTPEGRTFNQELSCELGREEHLILVSGHYEGFDARLKQLFPFEEISIGDFVLSGGEVAALVIIESVAREIPGVLGNPDSLESESFRSGLLDYPSYTRPPEFRGLRVPDILISGNHKLIDEWRLREALKNTIKKRPDLLEKTKLNEKMLKIVDEIKAELDHENKK
jgi:tRNA (guanine37-N1)-methyltransferase